MKFQPNDAVRLTADARARGVWKNHHKNIGIIWSCGKGKTYIKWVGTKTAVPVNEDDIEVVK